MHHRVRTQARERQRLRAPFRSPVRSETQSVAEYAGRRRRVLQSVLPRFTADQHIGAENDYGLENHASSLSDDFLYLPEKDTRIHHLYASNDMLYLPEKRPRADHARIIHQSSAADKHESHKPRQYDTDNTRRVSEPTAALKRAIPPKSRAATEAHCDRTYVSRPTLATVSQDTTASCTSRRPRLFKRIQSAPEPQGMAAMHTDTLHAPTSSPTIPTHRCVPCAGPRPATPTNASSGIPAPTAG